MDFEYDATTKKYLDSMGAFLTTQVEPAVSRFRQELAAAAHPWEWSKLAVLEELRVHARSRGLWNLFLPAQHGGRLTNLQYAPIAELSGRCLELAPAAMNCAAPDSGNMEVLSMFGTAAQRERWLVPLMDGTIRSSFAMTEPDVASSDATNIGTTITKDGNDYVINGRKWWITGAMNPNSEIFIVMGKTDTQAPRHRQHSQILVPRDTPGVVVARPMTVFGYDDRAEGGHAEIVLDEVRVPGENLIAGEGDGFAVAQARLGPGRIHHCMRAIGVAERAIELMGARANNRVAFGRPLGEQGVVREWMAHARSRIEQLRLIVLKTAWLIDQRGAQSAAREIQAIKYSTPKLVQEIVDNAIQLHGAGGLSEDFPLATSFAYARSLRFADGPDEVHARSLGRAELNRYG